MSSLYTFNAMWMGRAEIYDEVLLRSEFGRRGIAGTCVSSVEHSLDTMASFWYGFSYPFFV